MIAPTMGRRKGRGLPPAAKLIARRRTSAATDRHGIVSRNHSIAAFPPSARRPALRKEGCALARSFGSGFLSPQPPGAARIGPIRTRRGPARVGPFLFVPGCLSPRPAEMRQQGPAWRETALTRLPSMRIEPGYAARTMKLNASAQCSDVYAAPSIAPGLSRLPSWTYTTAPSTPSRSRFSIGTVQLSGLPFQSPTLRRLRTTLW